MERRDIEIFLTLADELHFGRTAERLHVSQARVSQTIKHAEREIGAPLFDRTSRRVELTPIGRRLRDDLLPAYQRIETALAAATAAGRGTDGEIRVAFEAPAVADLIGAVLDEFRANQPGCRVLVREAPFAVPLDALRTGEADVLVAALPVAEPGVVTGPVVHTESLLLAVSSRHPFARRQAVSVEDLARDTVLHAAWPTATARPSDTPWRTPAGRSITRGQAAATVQEVFAQVAAGDGVCPVAAHAATYFARPTIAFVPFTDAPPLEWGLVWRRSAETARVRAFVAAARNRAAG